MVIGGLMEETSANDDSGVPVASRVPWLGNLFKSTAKTGETRELVIFIRATVIGSGANSYHDADKLLYDTFVRDPRPIKF
jgi:type II secretory pathway component GspD/PulD (secretin)